MGIEWKEGAVCFSSDRFWFEWENHKDCLADCYGSVVKVKYLIDCHDFQLNAIKKGDYIEYSELDTEQKYNDAVEVFGLFGFYRYDCADFNETHEEVIVVDCDGDFIGDYMSVNCKRKLTFNQIMAIGELKRLEIERDNEPQFCKNEDGSMKLVKSNFSASPNSSNLKTSKDYLNQCIEVQNQRGEQYDSKGTGERSFAAAASAFNAMTGQNLKGSDVCLLLTCVKAVRQYSDTTRVHEDSLLDLVSYASLWAEELNKELK